MKLPSYPKYKPSGDQWLGDVPDHWGTIALRRISKRYTGGTPDRSNDSYWDEGSIPWVNSGAVNQGLITEPSAFITDEAYQNSSARWVAKGALVMALAGQGKTKGMVAQTGIATTCNQSMAAICPVPPAEARYLYWLLVSQYEHIRNMAGGEARDGLNLDILGSIPCLKLPPAEQRAIAAFLDRETGRIDKLVAKKRELIERLKEKRAALISRTVTRGLPPEAAAKAGLPVNPPLKPSGIDWLGEIPEHWTIMRLRRVVRKIEQGWSPECSNAFAAEDEWGVVKAGCCNGGRFNPDENKALPPDLAPQKSLEIKAGDLLMSRASGSEDLIGSVAFVPIGTRQQLLLSDKTYRLWCDEAMTIPEFLARVLQSPLGRSQIQTVISGAFGLAKNIAQSDVKDFVLTIPSVPEQASIAAYLNEATAKLDALVGKVEESIERLQEYRTALITAAVTGRIDLSKEEIANVR